MFVAPATPSLTTLPHVFAGKVGTGKSSLLNVLTGRNDFVVGNGGGAGTDFTAAMNSVCEPVLDRNGERWLCDSQGIGDASQLTDKAIAMAARPAMARMAKGASSVVLCVAHLDRFGTHDTVMAQIVVDYARGLPIVICFTKYDRFDPVGKIPGTDQDATPTEEKKANAKRQAKKWIDDEQKQQLLSGIAKAIFVVRDPNTYDEVEDMKDEALKKQRMDELLLPVLTEIRDTFSFCSTSATYGDVADLEAALKAIESRGQASYGGRAAEALEAIGTERGVKISTEERAALTARVREDAKQTGERIKVWEVAGQAAKFLVRWQLPVFQGIRLLSSLYLRNPQLDEPMDIPLPDGGYNIP